MWTSYSAEKEVQEGAGRGHQRKGFVGGGSAQRGENTAPAGNSKTLETRKNKNFRMCLAKKIRVHLAEHARTRVEKMRNMTL